MTEKKLLSDDELEKICGGIEPKDASDPNNMNRRCQAFIETGDRKYEWKDGYYKGNYTGGSFADVQIGNDKNDIRRVSLGNIRF